jgi:hypothetical protein
MVLPPSDIHDDRIIDSVHVDLRPDGPTPSRLAGWTRGMVADGGERLAA